MPASAQDLEPKAYSAAPIGANFLVTGVNWSHGNVLFDPTVPVTDVQANVSTLVVGMGHTFGLLGRLTRVQAVVPYVWADFTGNVENERTTRSRTGMADARVETSINLWGTRAMYMRDFVKEPRRTTVGVRLTAAAPSGQYYPDKLINIGANRWAFKPEIGVSWPHGPWDVDAYLGSWFFMDNSDFYPGTSVKTQSPVLATQVHISYTFRSRAWMAVDSTHYRGGEGRVDGKPPGVGLSNSRLGATLSIPVGTRYSAKLSYSSGIAVLSGTDFQTISGVWQILWLSPRLAGR